MRLSWAVVLINAAVLVETESGLKTVNENTDNRYYREVQPGTLAAKLFVVARERIFRDFMNRMAPAPSEKILDVGASDIVAVGANMLEQLYSFPQNITACGIGIGLEFKSAFPIVQYRQISPNLPLPFQDDSFDVVTSNAVLEHLGSFENQELFIRDLCRIGKRVFITVPNRHFPIEHHTAIPVAHYSDDMFRLACRITNKTEWSDQNNLTLTSRKRLWRLAATVSRSTAVGYTGLLLGPLSSNLYLAIH
jgi:SAM-dependent methyltransferase